MAALVSRQVVVGDVRTPVLVGGPASVDPSEAVLFVHGNPGAGSDWAGLLESVAGFAQVVAPDMPGFGQAERRPDQDYRVAAYARHLAGIVDALGLERVHLVAHDFGGPWALTWAAAHPERVASVTLLNTGLMLDYQWHRLARVWRTPLLGEVFQRCATPAITRSLLALDNPGLPSAWIDALAGHFRPWGTKRAVLRLYRSTDVDRIADLVGPLREAAPPCLVVWGTKDVYLPTVLARRQLVPFPDAEIHYVAGAGHWVWLERPDEVAEKVLPFLRGQLRGRVSRRPKVAAAPVGDVPRGEDPPAQDQAC